MTTENLEIEKKDQVQDYLNMSDEDILNMAPPEPTQAVEAPASDSAAEVPGTAGEATAGEEEEDTQAKTPEAQEEKKDEQEEQAQGEQGVGTEAKEEKGEAGAGTDDPAAVAANTPGVDYKSEYEKLLTPFKANGREISVKSVEDAKTLMQMGANYNKKMAALKPNLKLLKLLENNGLLDEEKLSYLIDLEKKNPQAIGKLVKDSGLNPLDLTTEENNAYKPTVQKIDDRELELDAVLDEIQGTDTYNRTLTIVSKEWDGKSKQVIADTPQLLKVINSHVQSGIYDLISNEMESERTFGRLQGLSDIEAYRQVGDRLNAAGAFNHLVQQPRQQTPSQPVIVTPKPKMGNDDKLREKKRAASAPSMASPSKAKPEYNPLSLSDDDFAKLVQPRFL